MSNDSSTKTVVFLLFIATLISIPLLHHQGTFSYGGFLIIILLFFLLYHLSRTNSFFTIKTDLPAHIVIPLLVLISQILGFTFFNNDPNGIRTKAQALFRIGYLTAIILTLAWLQASSKNKSISKWKIIILFIVAFLLRISLTRIVIEPNIDVFDLLKHGSAALLSGKNPYQSQFGGTLQQATFSGFNNFITYWPMAIYPFLLTAITSTDPRLLLSLCELALAILIYQDLKKQKTPVSLRLGIPLLLLYFPFFTTATAGSFIDPLILFFLYLAMKFRQKNKTLLTGVMFGCIIATKYFFLPPMVVFASSLHRIKKYWKMLFWMGMTTLLLLLPFLLWDSSTFLEQTVFMERHRQTTFLVQFGLGIHGFLWTQFNNLFLIKYWLWIPIGILLYILLVWEKNFKSIELEYIVVLFLLILVFPTPLGGQYNVLFGSMLIAAALFLPSRQKVK